MHKCSWQKKVAALVDGEQRADADAIRAHTADCATCRAYVQEVEGLHAIAAQHAALPHAIQDEQFPAFMAGIQEQLQPRPRHGGIWAKLSLTAAALIMALATFYLLTLGPDTVKATEVEHISSELEGVTVQWTDAEDGTATVWVNMGEDDLW